VAVMVFTHSQFASHESREKLISIRIIRYVLFRNLPKYRGAKICSINLICRRSPLNFSKILANGTLLREKKTTRICGNDRGGREEYGV
jgi:hypothetical protein